eukprot:PhF_6_TR38707/c0_g1_i1/m.57922
MGKDTEVLSPEEQERIIAGLEHNDAVSTFIFRMLYGALVGIVLSGIHFYFYLSNETMGHESVPTNQLAFAHLVTAITCLGLSGYVVFTQRSWLLLLNIVGCSIHFVIWLYFTYLVEGMSNVKFFHGFIALWLPGIGWMSIHVVKSVITVREHIAELRASMYGDHLKTL